MLNGLTVAIAYDLFFSHQQIVYTLGMFVCILYVLDQIRISYPKQARKFAGVTKYILRAEEQLKESAAVPYAMAILLTILSFPQTIAVIAIATLAFADPLSAIIGIKFGKHRIMNGKKSIEGSIAFFIATYLSVYLIFSFHGLSDYIIHIAAFIVALLGSLFELIPLRLDDNLTIPLFTAALLRVVCFVLGIAV